MNCVRYRYPMVDGFRRNADFEDPFPSLEDSESLHPIEPLNRARSLAHGTGSLFTAHDPRVTCLP